MSEFTFEERTLLCLYNSAGTRTGLIAALTDMRGYLEPDEAELRNLTDSALSKLGRMTDSDYATLDLTPDIDPEDLAYGD